MMKVMNLMGIRTMRSMIRIVTTMRMEMRTKMIMIKMAKLKKI